VSAIVAIEKDIPLVRSFHDPFVISKVDLTRSVGNDDA